MKWVNDFLNFFSHDWKTNIYASQLYDGTVRIFNKDFLIMSFRYYGGKRIYDLKMNTPNLIGKSKYKEIVLDDRVYRSSSKVKEILDSLFPNAKRCNNKMKHGLEYSIIESAILDENSEINVSKINENLTNVSINNENEKLTCSFKLSLDKMRLNDVFVKFYKKGGIDGKYKEIRIPKGKETIFIKLIKKNNKKK